jgi:hypothetical protein
MNKLFYIILISFMCCEARATVIMTHSTDYVSSYTCKNGAGVLSIRNNYTTTELENECFSLAIKERQQKEELARHYRCQEEKKDCTYCETHYIICSLLWISFFLFFFVFIIIMCS